MASEGRQHAQHNLCHSCIQGQYMFRGTNAYRLHLHHYASPQESKVYLKLNMEKLGRVDLSKSCIGKQWLLGLRYMPATLPMLWH